MPHFRDGRDVQLRIDARVSPVVKVTERVALSSSTPICTDPATGRSIRLDRPDAVISTYVTPANATLRMLLSCNWGPTLMNLGYFPFSGVFSPLNSLANQMDNQVRLVCKAAALLEVKAGHRVVDIACGRGKSTFMLTQMHPGVEHVVGLDLNPGSVEVARSLFGETHARRYLVADAADLPFSDQSFDRAVSIEAAFHFPDRAKFLREACRVLRPGGRLVVVDFVWNDAAARQHRNDDLVRTVRDIWGWEDLFTPDEYAQSAKTAGLVQAKTIDWSNRVSLALQAVFERVIWFSSTRWGHTLITRRHPQLLGLTKSDWEEVALSAKAHRRVCELSRYHAMVFNKPA